MLASLDFGNRSVVYAGAGHLPGHVLSASGRVEHTLESSGPPLGLFPQVRFSRSPSVMLNPGELFVLLTDGITESTAPGGGEWGATGVLDYLRAHRNCAASQLVKSLYHEARRFADDKLQKDDITSVVVKVEPPQEIVSH